MGVPVSSTTFCSEKWVMKDILATNGHVDKAEARSQAWMFDGCLSRLPIFRGGIVLPLRPRKVHEISALGMACHQFLGFLGMYSFRRAGSYGYRSARGIARAKRGPLPFPTSGLSTGDGRSQGGVLSHRDASMYRGGKKSRRQTEQRSNALLL
jgi:hypothetical protein